MSQMDNPYAQEATYQEPPRTSGLAITALVLSLIGIIPCLGLITAPLGLLLGLIGAATIGGNPNRKGMGFAITAVVIGLLCAGVQGYGAYWFYDKGRQVYQVMMAGPEDALTAGFAGDVSGFKDRFHGPGSAADDAVAQAFINDLRNRYGDFVSANFPQNQASSPPPTGQPSMVLPYEFEFANKTVSAEAELIMADQQTGAWVMKWSYIEVFDPDQGDLRYPPQRGGGAGPVDAGGDGGDAEGDGGGGGEAGS
jgi:hypothetical protein